MALGNQAIAIRHQEIQLAVRRNQYAERDQTGIRRFSIATLEVFGQIAQHLYRSDNIRRQAAAGKHPGLVAAVAQKRVSIVQGVDGWELRLATWATIRLELVRADKSWNRLLRCSG